MAPRKKAKRKWTEKLVFDLEDFLYDLPLSRRLKMLERPKRKMTRRYRGTHRLERLQSRRLVMCEEAATCPVCLSDLLPGRAVILKECLHTFCRPCLVGSIIHSDGGRVRCPFLDCTYSCQAFLQDQEIKALLKKKQLDLYLEKSARLGEVRLKNSFHCRTVDCPGWCEFELGVRQFRCYVCRRDNCIPCKMIHTGTCQDYLQSDRSNKFIEMKVTRRTWMRCPRCDAVISKKGGCNLVICCLCKQPISWYSRDAL